MNRQIKGNQIANKYIKKCSNSEAITVTDTKVTMRSCNTDQTGKKEIVNDL